jgi:vanillate O-demethylase monooxygenase subunit
MVRNFDIHDRGLTTRIRDAQAGVFAEDVAVLEAQQENILRRPDRKLSNLNIDAGGVYARRIIERELARKAGR